MICFLLILGSIQICCTTEWNLGGLHGDLTFGEISLDHTSINHDLPKSDDKTNKKSTTGLQAWLTDVVIGNHKNNHIQTIIKNIGYPVYKDVEFKIPYPEIYNTQQPYPIFVPVLHPVPFEITKTVVKTVEKKIPTPIEKIIPVPVEKPVPFEVVKHVPVLVDKKIPIKIPVYKTVHHEVH